jgi:hypothetical protein
VIVVGVVGVVVAPPRHDVFQVVDGERSGGVDQRLLGPQSMLISRTTIGNARSRRSELVTPPTK